MRRWFARGLALVVGVLAAEVAAAQELPPTLPAPAPAAPAACPGACAPTVEKTISLHRIYIMEEQAATTLPRLTARDVELGRERRPYLELDFTEARYTVTELELKPREIDQEVETCTVEPQKTIDPCTGKECTVYVKVPKVQKVRITVYDAVPVQKVYVLRTPYLKTKDEEVIVKGLVLDATTEPAITKTLRAIPVDQQIKVQVPIQPLPCLPPACPK